MAGTKRRRVTLYFTKEQDVYLNRLVKSVFPVATETTALREILTHLGSGCVNVLQAVAKAHGFVVIPIGEWEAMPRTRANSEEDGSKKETEKKKKKEDPRLAPLSVSKEVIDYLNEQAGGNFQHGAASHRKLIQDRLNAGATVEDLKTVITKKCAEWNGSPMASNLRPSTLFKACHFDDYLGAPEPGEQKRMAFTDGEKRAERYEKRKAGKYPTRPIRGQER